MRQQKRIDCDTGGFKSAGEFYARVKAAGLRQPIDSRLKTLTENVDSSGGFLIPEAWRDELMFVAIENSIARRQAIVVPMTTDELSIPVIVDSDRATALFGGVVHKWIKELGDKSTADSDIKFGRILLTAHKAVILASASNELERDAPRFGFYISEILGRAMAFYQDWYFLRGNGAGQPLGVLNSGALITETRTISGKFDIADIGHLARRLLPACWETAEWLFNADAIGELFELSAVSTNPVSVIDLAARKIFGSPITPTEMLPGLGTAGDIALIDFSHYVIGEREITISYSDQVPDYFEDDRGVWKIVARYDGQPILNAPITPKSGANSLSPFVALTTAS